MVIEVVRNVESVCHHQRGKGKEDKTTIEKDIENQTQSFFLF